MRVRGFVAAEAGGMWIPWSVLPSGVSMLTRTAAAGSGPGGPTAPVGNSIWVCMAAIMRRVAPTKTANPASHFARVCTNTPPPSFGSSARHRNARLSGGQAALADPGQAARFAPLPVPGRNLASHCRFERRGYPVDREGLFDQRRAGEFGRWRVDVAAAGQHERDPAKAQLGRDRPDVLALQIDVEDGN